MQNENIKKLLMASVGMYLVYTGITLIRDVLISEPKNAVIFMIAGGIFVVIGLIAAVMNLRSYIGYVKEMMAASVEESMEDDTEDHIEDLLEAHSLEEQLRSISVTIPERENRKKETALIKFEHTEELELEVTAEGAEELEPEVIAEDAEDLEMTDEIKLDAEDATDIEDEE